MTKFVPFWYNSILKFIRYLCMKKIIAACVLSIVSFASHANDAPDYLVNFEHKEKKFSKGELITTSSLGGGIQWNEDYVVTAAHVKVDPKDGVVEYVCSDCDIQFVRKKGSHVATWRETIPFEELFSAGSTLEVKRNRAVERKIVVSGYDIFMETPSSENSNYLFHMAALDTVIGMSGGPVYGKDNKVVGMLVAGTMIKKVGTTLYDEDNNALQLFKKIFLI